MTARNRFVGALAIAALPLGSATVQAAPIYDPVNNLTYVRDATARTWNDAQAAAVAQGGNLARVRDAGANEAIRAASNGGGWIGATDQAVEGDWRWSNNNDQFWQGLAANATPPGMPVGGRYTNWNGGEPNDGGDWGDEGCVELRSDGRWNDTSCGDWKHYLCEYDGKSVGTDWYP